MHVRRYEDRHRAVPPAGHVVLLDGTLPLPDRRVIGAENVAQVGRIENDGIGLAAVFATSPRGKHPRPAEPLGHKTHAAGLATSARDL